MLTKAQIKYIRSLTQQKFRNEYKVFIAEGEKIALEWLRSANHIHMIVATEDFLARHTTEIGKHPGSELLIVKESELDAISTLQTPNKVLLVVGIPGQGKIPVQKEWYFALDGIQDPGNMGTIIRVADWFGVPNIVCSPGCVDIYNPKVVQSAMGGHLRVRVYQSDILSFLSSSSLPKYAAVLNGDNVYKMERQTAGILIIGNESRGLSEEIVAAASHKVTIPGRGGAESLNAGISAGILCALLLPC